MNRKLLSITILCLSFLYILPIVFAEESTQELPCRYYFYFDNTVMYGDTISWSFVSSTSEIYVIAMTQEEFDTFYNLFFSAGHYRRLSYGLKSDSGEFQPTEAGTWYICFLNAGLDCVPTTITMKVTVNPYGSIFLAIGVLCILAVIIYVAIYFSKEKKKKLEKVDQPAQPDRPVKLLEQEKQQITQEKSNIEFCPFCGVKITQINPIFCPKCGNKIL